MNKEEIENYKKEYDNMSLCDLADELVEPLFTVKKELAKTIYIHYAEERDKNYKLQQENQELKKENLKLKKQLEEANEKILLLQASEPMLEYKKALEENQQKEFIKFLENEKNIYPYDISDYTYEDIINTILSKYYEIIDK